MEYIFWAYFCQKKKKKKRKGKSYTEHNDIIMEQNGQFCTAFFFV